MKCNHDCHRSANYVPYISIYSDTDIDPLFVVEISNHHVCNRHSANGESEKKLTEHFSPNHTEEVVQLCRKAFATWKKNHFSLSNLDEERLRVKFKKVAFN